MAANSLHHAKDYLGEFFRRITRKLANPYHLLGTKESYNESVFHRCDEEGLRRAYFRSADKPLNSGFKSTERVMFLGSRLVESDLRPWHRS
jgi:hypothetical protein